METRAHGVLGGKIGRIKSSNVDPVWLAQKLLTANIIGEYDLEKAKDVGIPKPERRAELVEIVQGNGRRGVFQTFVNIFLSEPHLKWLGEELQGRYCQWPMSIHYILSGALYLVLERNVNTVFIREPHVVWLPSMIGYGKCFLCGKCLILAFLFLFR